MNTGINLPTDNLYKFLFIGGLLLICYSSYLSVKISDQVIDLKKTAFNYIEQKINFSSKKTEEISLKIDNLLQNGENYYKYNGNVELKNLQKEIFDINNLQRDVLEKNNNNFYENYFNIKTNTIEKSIKEVEICGKTGIILLIIGMISWYFITQICNDKILILQKEQLEKQNKFLDLQIKKILEKN